MVYSSVSSCHAASSAGNVLRYLASSAAASPTCPSARDTHTFRFHADCAYQNQRCWTSSDTHHVQRILDQDLVIQRLCVIELRRSLCVCSKQSSGRSSTLERTETQAFQSAHAQTLRELLLERGQQFLQQRARMCIEQFTTAARADLSGVELVAVERGDEDALIHIPFRFAQLARVVLQQFGPVLEDSLRQPQRLSSTIDSERTSAER